MESFIQMSTFTNAERIKINVGGVVFICFTNTLQRFPLSILGRLCENSEHFDKDLNEYFFDRNPEIFNYILDAFRTGVIHVPKNTCGTKFKEELEFWDLSEQLVSQCCWETLYSSEENIQTIETLQQFYETSSELGLSKKSGSLRHAVWLFLHEPKSSKLAKMWCFFVLFLISMSVLVTAIETVPSARSGMHTHEENVTFHKIAQLLQGSDTDTRFYQILVKKPHILLTLLDAFCFVILTAEMILVFWLCPRKVILVKSWLHMSEVICTLSYWFFFVCERNAAHIDSVAILRAMIVCKFLTNLKLVRLLRIAKHFPALKIMGLTFTVSKDELRMLSLLLFILTSFFGSLVYMSERSQGNTFDNMFTGMYWALITLTTVGYGDVAPGTTYGQIVATICSVSGIMMLVIPTGIFASNFNNLYRHFKYINRHVNSKPNELRVHADEPLETVNRDLNIKF